MITDGIIKLDEWKKVELKEKVLVILKEAYCKGERDYDWDLPKWINQDKCCSIEDCKKSQNCLDCEITGHTYNRVAEWIMAITEYTKDYDNWLGVEHNTKAYNARRRELLQKSAIINIKKENGKPYSEKTT